MDLEGSVVEFIDSGTLKLGYVRRHEHRKIRVVDPRGRQSSVSVSRVVVVHPAIREAEFPTACSRILEHVDAIRAGIDVHLLWNDLHTRAPEYSLRELCEAYFGECDPERESGMYRAVSEDTLFFRRSGSGFAPRSGDQVSTEQLRRTREQEHEQHRGEVTRLLRLAVTEEPPPEAMAREDGWPGLLERLERWLRQREADDVSEALERVVGEVQAREVAYDLLVRYGQIPSSEDRFLLVRGLPTVFSREVLEAAGALDAGGGGGPREDRTGLEAYAIDDPYTVEIDDALTVTHHGPDTVVGIHIADVTAFVAKDDPLDREARRRSSTIYLPNVRVPMFPPRLSMDLASLIEGAPRPAFTIEARFSENAFVEARFFQSLIRVTDRLDYEEADRALAEANPALTRLHAIARELYAARARRGAQVHRRPEVKVHVEGDRILVERFETDTPARLIVSEMMILANQLAATRAAQSGIPIIYRIQEPSPEPRPDVSGLPEVMQFEILRRNFKRSHLSLHPSPHAGLGLDQYTQLSSPIRRYADLVTQRQFASALRGDPLPYEREELLDLMTSCEAREVEIRRLEQASTTWWTLVHLGREHLGRALEAVAIDTRGTVELSDFLVRAKLREHDALDPGAPITVRIESVDAEHGTIRLA